MAFLKPEDIIDAVTIKIMMVDNIWDRLGVTMRFSLRVLGSLGQKPGTNTQPRVLWDFAIYKAAPHHCIASLRQDQF